MFDKLEGLPYVYFAISRSRTISISTQLDDGRIPTIYTLWRRNLACDAMAMVMMLMLVLQQQTRLLRIRESVGIRIRIRASAVRIAKQMQMFVFGVPLRRLLVRRCDWPDPSSTNKRLHAAAMTKVPMPSAPARREEGGERREERSLVLVASTRDRPPEWDGIWRYRNMAFPGSKLK